MSWMGEPSNWLNGNGGAITAIATVILVIPFLNKRLSLTKNWKTVVAQLIAPLTCECIIAFQNLYNATLFFRFVVLTHLLLKSP